MAKFRVLAGLHSEGGEVYEKGEIVDSKSDLTKFNSPGSYKFERIPDEPADSGKQPLNQRAASNAIKLPK